jgi:glycogen phosphorylase
VKWSCRRLARIPVGALITTAPEHERSLARRLRRIPVRTPVEATEAGLDDIAEITPLARFSGESDLARAAQALADRLPQRLGVFARLAYNYRWSWSTEGAELFRAIDPERFAAVAGNPLPLLADAPASVLARAAADEDLVRRAEELARQIDEDLLRPPAPGPVSPAHPVAFLCAEVGVHESLPVYAGGLGGLAGDLLKQASDAALPLVAVSVMYRQGAYRQRLDASGWQSETWHAVHPERLPAALVTGAAGEPVTIRVPIDDHDVIAQIWRVSVGRVPLYLLDTDRSENARVDRWIGARLYDGDRHTRLAQYALLGIGGVRALRELGIDPCVVHLNEGHAAFAALELAREGREAGLALDEALAAARRRVIFTTHTPVAAGNEEYETGELMASLSGFLRTLSPDPEPVLALGRIDPADPQGAFGLTPLALRTSRFANGVSRRHGEVARHMWQPLWPGRWSGDLPIGHVTNGVHLPTWMAPPLRRLLARHLGPDFEAHCDDAALWAGLDAIPDEELWAVRNELRAELIAYVRDKSVSDRLGRGGHDRHYVQAAAQGFDEQVLTVGFARRIAAYKRLYLLTRDPARALRLLDGPRPIQIVIAGKAHPMDREAKALIQQIFPLREQDPVGRRVAFLEDYDLGMARRLVRGCDVWLNLPRAPLEASGTSGMKAVLNGGLHVSVRDGWWDEAYDGSNGWALGGDDGAEHHVQDDRDANALYSLFESEIVPLFYERDADGLPRGWLRRVRASLRSLAPVFNTRRALGEYVERAYRTEPG